MKKTIILLMMAALGTSSWAQEAVITGKFKKMLPNGRPVDRVFISKPEAGDLTIMAEPLIDSASRTFHLDLVPADQNVIRYVGVFDEQYPFYLRKGEKLDIDAADGKITYSGKLSKENQVFADWYKMLAPLRFYGYSAKGYLLPSERYVALLDSLSQPVNNFLKGIHTGNDAFDKQVKYLLTYSYKLDVTMPVATGLNVGAKKDYPAYLTDFFKNETFSDKQIWTLPFAFKYMGYFAFAKHIIYGGEQGIAGEMLVPEIADKELRANFVLSQAEKGTTQNLVAFLEKNHSAMITDSQKAKMKVLEARAKVQVEGGEWIDFSYPDRNGKMCRLSDNLGKVVLVDVWATWCKPCLAEQPAMERLEKAFEGKDVVFLAVSVDTDKEKWKAMVESKKLSGLHLFTNSKGPIVTDYELTGIPRYILFDKNGKTVSFDAPRPSDPKLQELINSKL
ncbi:thiol-disulfide isomerase/thioredoxin [Mucilaginibacter oryzae]|uniref:Thiol-disulfide isomerase/thioredoxin n=1 Tax=Mucilaginibacter oryzae TaxID=468058 RepID=A0A316HF24_9SPHI|nr:TlpA disulfide reductase family protein [Mucilaginibacter oryzae]PWK79819.1 thiol-disulfide isomerase/thioredoxin [Mucilaginibacter oryzae]